MLTPALLRCLLLVPLLCLAASCQRATYSFQPPGSRYEPATASAAALPLSATDTLATPHKLSRPAPGAATTRQPRWRHSRPRLVAGRRPVAGPAIRPGARLLRPFVVLTHPRPALKLPAEELPVSHRSRLVAIILGVLSITYLPLSLHNFYLGYYGRGAAAIGLLVVGLYLFLLGAVGSFGALFGVSSGLTTLGIIGVVVLGGWFLWQLSDLLRIITGDLQPRNGEYDHK